MKKLIYILFVSTLIFTSCNDYLDEKPDKSQQEIEFVSDIELMLDNTADGFLSDVSFSNITGDQKFHQEVYEVMGPWIEFSEIQKSVWADEISSVSDDSWIAAYRAIWVANFIINSVDGLEGDAKEKANLKAEAHLIKAFKQFNLALKHCLYPSDANSDEMGIPIKNKTDFGQHTVRASLKETFEQIELDIIEGLKIDKKRTNSWRESDASAAALAARFYLYVQDYVNAKKYAEQALSLHSTMVNINDIELAPGWADDITTITTYYSLYSPEFYASWESQYKIYVDEFVFSFLTPTADLLALYQPEDLRMKYFYTTGYLEGFYDVKENNIIYSKHESVMSGTDVAEMYLILAECAARNNDFSNCMNNLEMVRVNRFSTDDYVALAEPTSVNDAIMLVVDERRREFPFTSLVWSDIKRLNAEGLVDPIILSKDYFELGAIDIDFDKKKVYTLEPNSRKYARPLPKEVIILTEGSVKQNTY